MTARVAKIVLAARRLRWSSPLLFNDPFDITQELRLNFDEHGLSAALTDRVAWLIEHGDSSTPVKHPVYGLLVRLLIRASPDRRATASEFRRRMDDPTPGQTEA